VILDRLFPSAGRPNDASNESIAVRQYLTSMMLLIWDIFSDYAGFATRLPSLTGSTRIWKPALRLVTHDQVN
jgi:vancomycin permeability regulator SanA